MIKLTRILLVLSLFIGVCSTAQATNSNLNQIEIPEVNATVAKQRNANPTSWWLKRHLRFNDDVKKNSDAQIAFIGDSITHSWENGGRSIWDKYYKPRKAVNLGISGDRTEHVIWRLQNGNLEHIKPKLFVIMIGTNNTGHKLEKPEHIAYGIASILKILREKQPQAKILLLGIFPRGNTSLDKSAPNTEMFHNNEKVNRIIQTYADFEKIHYLNINHRFLDSEALLSRKSMPDLLHPQGFGYQIWADAIEPKVSQLLGEGKIRQQRLHDEGLTQWTHKNGSAIKKNWTYDAKRRTLTHTGTGQDIITKKQYKNFVLTFDFKVSKGANSGVKYKLRKFSKNNYLGIEYQIMDDIGNKQNKQPIRNAASAYDIYTPNHLKQLKPVGEFNRAMIVVNGTKVEHWLNGARVIAYDINSVDFDRHIGKSKFKGVRGFGLNDYGRILLQTHGGQVQYRDMMIQELAD